ncbi:MAG: 1-acyl-sn-glycerol-3-phosphate acyltransferase [Rhodobiaceae bacterium]|nr:1-acyl-sn-glycerol-3-phosphate acyltransferase [Rhodobiaceae bacterium]MCC0056826.1 1-acyl-sn-glycerol-3-phosphate acyltransferase [Rhodobiaceae bacterium]
MAARSLIFNILFYANLFVFMIVGLPLTVSKRTVWIVAFAWCRSSAWLLKVVCGTKIEFRGLENIPKGGFVVASKHQSFLETFGMAPLFRRPTFILKHELVWLPLFGWYMIQTWMVPVRRGARSKALRQMNADAALRLADNRQIIIFPEGTRRAPGAPPQYKIGAAFLYANSGVPVLPVAMNTGLFWPRRRFMRYPGTAVIEFLPPIQPGLEHADFMTRLQTDIETACDRLLQEAAQDNPALPLPQTALTRLAELAPA